MNPSESGYFDQNRKSQAAWFIRYYEATIARQTNERARQLWGLGLVAAQWWMGLAALEKPSEAELDELLTHLEKHLREHGSAWLEMHLYIKAWKRDLYGGITAPHPKPSLTQDEG